MKTQVRTTILATTILASQAPAVVVYDNMIQDVNGGRVNDVSSPFGVHADNFTLASGSTVNRFDWLGIYKGPTAVVPVDEFVLTFFNFSNGQPETEAFAILPLETVSREVDERNSSGNSLQYSYTAIFPDLNLDAGSYLVAIVNDPDIEDEWLWSANASAPAQSYLQRSAGSAWNEFSGNGVAEFAFSLSAVPEPTTSTILLLGCSLLFTLRQRLP